MSKIIDFLKKNLCFIIFLVVFGLVGGYFTALYSIESLSAEVVDELVAQVGSIEIGCAIITIQSLVYALVLGLIGRALAEKLGIWKSSRPNANSVLSTLLVALIGGAALILIDAYFFSSFYDTIRNSYLAKPSVNYIIASVTYGGVIEEIMLRLFFMSLIAFILMKLSKRDTPTDGQLIAANIIAALLFAAGHLPATFTMIENVDAMIIFRCFLMNGGFGLAFGHLYRKYGLPYACLGHAGVHIVSKLIWILFV